jgi:aldehyde dehydrogenase (NAD+)
MTVQLTNWIAGREVPSDEAPNERRDPAACDVVVATFPEATGADVTAAVDAAVAAGPAWAETGPSTRAAMLEGAAAWLDARTGEIAAELVAEEGKPLAAACGEVERCAANLRLYAGEALRLGGHTHVVDGPATVSTVAGPVGVVGVITPWNFPLNLPSRKVGPALAAGNTVVFKPSPCTPITADRLVRALVEAGLPAGVVNLVHGTGAGPALVADERVAAVTFTGSTGTGERIHRAVGLGRRVQLELGGKNPIVVLADADLDRAAQVVATASFNLTGQACTGAGRILVQDEVHDELLERVVALAGAQVLGRGSADGVTMGPLIDEAARDRVHGAVVVAARSGARVVCGGEPPSGPGLDRGWFYPPTVLDGVTPDMAIARDEVFGPVVGFERVADLDEAIARGNATGYGLAAAICTTDLAAAQRFSSRIEAGMVKVNQPTTGVAPNVPFGGLKRSGTETSKEQLGAGVMDFYLRTRTVYVAA